MASTQGKNLLYAIKTERNERNVSSMSLVSPGLLLGFINISVTDRERERQRETETERDRERERERQTDRQTDRERDRENSCNINKAINTIVTHSMPAPICWTFLTLLLMFFKPSDSFSEGKLSLLLISGYCRSNSSNSVVENQSVSIFL